MHIQLMREESYACRCNTICCFTFLIAEKVSKNDWRIATPVELPKDEDGFTIRPDDPWGESSAAVNHSDGDISASDTESDGDETNKTFHGLKVSGIFSSLDKIIYSFSSCFI